MTFDIFVFHGTNLMRFLALTLLLIATPGLAMPKKTSGDIISMNSAHSAELKSLNSNNDDLQKTIACLKREEDRWNKRNGVFALIAVLTASLFGLLSYLSAKNTADRSLEQRPLVEQQGRNDKRIREILDSDASMKIGDADLKAANAIHLAESEKLKRVELEAKIAPRQLTMEEKAQIGSLSVPPGSVIVLTSYVADAEGMLMASQIKEALDRAGLPVSDNRGTLLPKAGGLIFGIDIGGETELSGSLRKIFKRESRMSLEKPRDTGIKMTTSFNTFTDKRAVAANITVGVKPIE